jgi:peptide/nickel transport system permease protein
MIMQQKRLVTRVSFAGDLIIFLLLLLGGWHWFPAVVAAEALMWMVRLSWLSPLMLRFILMRLLHLIPLVLVVIAIGFGLIQLAPGDVFNQMALNPNIRPSDLEQFRESFGLDKPWYVQFFHYIWNVLHGNFGFSATYKAPVFLLVSQRALNTLILAICSLLVAWGFSIPAGMIAATHQYQWQDQAISAFAFFGLSIPNYFLAFLLIVLVSSTGNWLPIGSMYSIDVGSMGPLERFFDLVKHLIIPTFVLATAFMARLTRIMRSNMLEIMNQQYIVTARAKGVREHHVITRHALRNAINPMLSIMGLQFSFLLSGAALVEAVLAWPGLGHMILQAILTQDLYLVIGSLIMTVSMVVVGNLLADIALAVTDPRVRIS